MKKGLVFLAFERKAIATATTTASAATIATIESLGCSLQIILATLPLLPLKVLVPSLQFYLATLPLCCLL